MHGRCWPLEVSTGQCTLTVLQQSACAAIPGKLRKTLFIYEGFPLVRFITACLAMLVL